MSMEAWADISIEALEGAPPSASGAVWDAVGRIIDGVRSLDDLREHGLELLAARRWRALGLAVPEALAAEERRTALRMLAVRPLLERIGGLLERPILIKGPELAVRYPDPVARRFSDLDLLVPDAAEGQRALLAAGFREVGDPAYYADIHHLRPLVWPDLPLAIELHMAPKWIEDRPAPRYGQLLEASVPALCGIGGILAPAPAHHALLVAVHSWVHEPLRRLSDLIDVAVLAAEATPRELEAAGLELGVPRVWTATSRALDASLSDGRATWPLRTWGRNVVQARRRTVFESHLEQLLSPFSADPPLRAGRKSLAAACDIVFPGREEAWMRKLRRTKHALRDARVPRSAHDHALDRWDLL